MELKRSSSTRRSLIPVFLLLIILIATYVGLVFFSKTVGLIFWHDVGSRPETLDTVEVTEYMGKKLSSIDDFIENSIKGPQHINAETYSLLVTGLVDEEREYSYQDVVYGHRSYKKVVILHCVEGWNVTILWEGVLVKDLLEEAGVNASSKVVIFHAVDGYTTSLPLDFIIDNNILMAYKMNNVVLPPERGFPFQLVAEDKLGYKWIKWITKIELSDDTGYLGYWESYGFPNDAELWQHKRALGGTDFSEKP